MLRLNFFLALGYFLGGYIGNLITIPPSHAGLIWPAAGIALAGIITYGRSVIPGIWLGAFFFQGYVFLDTVNLHNVPASLVIGAIASTAATAQALLGAWLIKRSIGANNPLIDDSSILRFFTLGGPLSCMISATAGVIMLCLEGAVSLENCAFSWLNWWVGDVIGVLIFTPFLLCFIGSPRSQWRLRISSVALPLLVLSLLVAALFQLGESKEQAPQFYDNQIPWNIWWLILGGFLLTGLTGLGLLMLTGRTMQTEGIVKIRTQELENEIARRKKIIRQHDDHNKVLQAIASPAPLSDILELIVTTAEKNYPDCICSILLMDEEGLHLHTGAAPSLPKFYNLAIDGIAIGDGVGCSGTAAFKGQRVIIENVFEHPYCRDYVGLAKQEGLAACWSEPIFSSTQRVLGVFAIYHKTPYYPDFELLTEINELAQLSSIAIERKVSEEKVTHLAFFDALTNLPNRRLFMANMEKALSSDIRHKTNGALLYLDLDHFKTLNDSLGHDIGDELLIQVANRLKQCVRDEDTVARLGGDEFVILLSCREISQNVMAEHALTLAERVQTALQAPYQLKEHIHHITPSIGITLIPNPDFTSSEPLKKADTLDTKSSSADRYITPGELLKQADTAMYHSKNRGRNLISFYNEDMQRRAYQRLMMERDLRVALAEQQFSLHYQPQFDLKHQLLGAEAFLRWQHPEKGMIPLADFIHVAEETGLILHIGDWVIRQACQQLIRWPSLPRLAVNISPKQFRQPKFAHKIASILSEYGVEKSRLTLEIIEGSLVEDLDDTIEKLQALQNLGIHISIDDFGTGYSSLSFLKLLPLNQLKIDQSFVRDIITDANDAVIVDTIIVMAKHFGLSVIAEGVETIQQAQYLRDSNCKGYQGYLFSKPLAADEFYRQFIKE